jgi:hypothetical protein
MKQILSKHFQVTEPEGSTFLITDPTTNVDTESVHFISHPDNLILVRSAINRFIARKVILIRYVVMKLGFGILYMLMLLT